MPGARWLAGIALAFATLPACAAAPPDPDDIVRQLALPKPSAAALAGPARGIRAVAPAAAPQIDLAIPFAPGSARVEAAGAPLVAALGHALASTELGGDSFRIEGHADTMGMAAANLALSQRRAEAVVAVLTTSYGIEAGRLTAQGVGSAQLVVQTPDQTDEPRNRVVRVVNLGPAR